MSSAAGAAGAAGFCCVSTAFTAMAVTNTNATTINALLIERTDR
jgi:hypothetical protein